jgi:hypothetical protein
VWSLASIEKGSAGANAIVKFASSLLGVASDRGRTQQVADELLSKDIEDVRVAVWQAGWLLTGPNSLETKRWPDPWEKPKEWIPQGVDPGYRLNSLYRFLVGYVFAQENDQDAARKFGTSVSQFSVMKNLVLDLDKVYHSLKELSKWRNQRSGSLICGLKITNIWESSSSVG